MVEGEGKKEEEKRICLKKRRGEGKKRRFLRRGRGDPQVAERFAKTKTVRRMSP
jgi:hypothetical protein